MLRLHSQTHSPRIILQDGRWQAIHEGACLLTNFSSNDLSNYHKGEYPGARVGSGAVGKKASRYLWRRSCQPFIREIGRNGSGKHSDQAAARRMSSLFYLLCTPLFNHYKQAVYEFGEQTRPPPKRTVFCRGETAFPKVNMPSNDLSNHHQGECYPWCESGLWGGGKKASGYLCQWQRSCQPSIQEIGRNGRRDKHSNQAAAREDED